MILSQFGMKSSQASDVLNVFSKVSQQTGVSVSDLFSNIQTNGATFKDMGLNVQQSAELMGRFQKAGISSDQMMTGLKKAAANFKSEGKSMSDGLGDLINRLQDSSTKGEATQEAFDLFGKKAGNSFITAASEGRINLSNLSTTLDGYSGNVKKTFKATEDPIDKAKTAFNAIKLSGAELGASVLQTLEPGFKIVAGGAKDLAKWFQNLSSPMKTVLSTALLLTAGLSGGLMIFGKITSGISSGIRAIKSISTAVGGVTKLFPIIKTGISAIWGVIQANPVIAIITVITIALVALYNNCKPFRDFVNNFIKLLATTFSNTIKNLQKTVTTVWNAIKTATTTVFNGIKNTITTVWNGIRTVVSTVLNVIKTVITSGWNAIKSVTSSIFNGIKNVISTVFSVIAAVFNTYINVYKTEITTAWNVIKNVTSSVWNGIKSVIDNVANAIKSVVTSVFNGVKGTIEGIWNGIKNVTTSVWNGIKGAITSPINGAKDVVKSVIDTMKGFFNFNWKLPSIKLPHFSVKGSANPIDWISHGVPSISVKWYAKGGVFTQPTIMNGFGEAGTEYALPLNRSSLQPLAEMLAEMIPSVNIATALENLTLQANFDATIDGKQLTTTISNKQGLLVKRKGAR